jgi:hypothetical protein
MGFKSSELHWKFLIIQTFAVANTVEANLSLVGGKFSGRKAIPRVS